MFFSLVYYLATFFEERMKFIKNFIKKILFIIIFLNLLLPFSNFSIKLFLISILSNIFWSLVIFVGFPFIPIFRPDLILGFIFTLITHLIWMFELMEKDISGFLAISIFLFIVWSLPFIIIISLSAIDEETAEIKNKNSNIWKDHLQNLIKFFKSFLPHNGNKYL